MMRKLNELIDLSGYHSRLFLRVRVGGGGVVVVAASGMRKMGRLSDSLEQQFPVLDVLHPVDVQGRRERDHVDVQLGYYPGLALLEDAAA